LLPITKDQKIVNGTKGPRSRGSRLWPYSYITDSRLLTINTPATTARMFHAWLRKYCTGGPSYLERSTRTRIPSILFLVRPYVRVELPLVRLSFMCTVRLKS
jgi:hypothetical protein